jgi:hypothetical protein
MSAQSGTNDPQVSITPMDQNTMMNMINQLHGQLQAQSSQISSLQQQLSSAHNNVPVNTAIDPALSTGPKKTNPQRLMVNHQLILGLPIWIAMCKDYQMSKPAP